MPLRIAILQTMDVEFPEILNHLRLLEKRKQMEIQILFTIGDSPPIDQWSKLASCDGLIARQRGCASLLPKHIGNRSGRPFHAVSLSRGADRFSDIKGQQGVIVYKNEEEGKANLEGTSQLAVMLAQMLLRTVHKALANMAVGVFNTDDFNDAQIVEGKTWMIMGAGNMAQRMVPKILPLLPRQILIINRTLDRKKFEKMFIHVPNFGIGTQTFEVQERVESNGVTYEAVIRGYHEEPIIVRGRQSGDPMNYNLISSFLGESDIVSVHNDALKGNTPMYNESFFSLMKYDSYFINVSRAHLVDEDALVSQLKVNGGKLAGVATDVLSALAEEMHDPAESKLWREHVNNPASNILITPHIGGDTQLERFRVAFPSVNKFLRSVSLEECSVPERFVGCL